MTKAKDNIITLDEPIKRGDTVVETVQVRKPNSGECRGLAIADIGTGDIDAYCTLLPRITSPALTKQEVSELDLADMVQFVKKVSDFLVPKAGLDSLAG